MSSQPAHLPALGEPAAGLAVVCESKLRALLKEVGGGWRGGCNGLCTKLHAVAG